MPRDTAGPPGRRLRRMVVAVFGIGALSAVMAGVLRCTPASALPATTLAITNVNVVDVVERRILPGRTVLVAGERIVDEARAAAANVSP